MKLADLNYIIAPSTKVIISLWSDDENAEVNPVQIGPINWINRGSYGAFEEVTSIYPRGDVLEISVKEHQLI